MAILQDQNRSCFVQVATTATGTIPNSSGTATVGNGDLVPFIELELQNEAPTISSKAKTQGRARIEGVAGRRNGRWRIVVPFRPSGTAGTAPDIDPLLVGLFGQAASVSAGTSVTYSLHGTNIPELTIWEFLESGSNVMHRVARGCLVDSCEITTGDEELVMTMSGPCAGVIDAVNFASYDTVDKGGLSAFPSKPGSPTSVGGILAAFLGSLTIDGVSSHQVQSFGINFINNLDRRYVFGARSPEVAIAKDLRDFRVNLAVYEENTTNLAALRFNNYENDVVDGELVFGDTAGQIATFTFGKLVMPSERKENQNNESIIRFDGISALASAVGANDEVELVFT